MQILKKLWREGKRRLAAMDRPNRIYGAQHLVEEIGGGDRITVSAQNTFLSETALWKLLFKSIAASNETFRPKI